MQEAFQPRENIYDRWLISWIFFKFREIEMCFVFSEPNVSSSSVYYSSVHKCCSVPGLHPQHLIESILDPIHQQGMSKGPRLIWMSLLLCIVEDTETNMVV